jgi:dodecin
MIVTPTVSRTEGRMSDHVYKSVELTGSSKVGTDDAIRNAIARASKTLHNLRWFEVTQVRGHLENGEIVHWQVTVKVSFTLDET